MNYFELYNLPVSFNPDQNLVKQQFYALSKKYHPDFYINETEEKQQEVLELSTLNNKAFQVLKDANKRLQYVLDLEGQITEGENYALPQDFLMEMMDVNEALMDLQFEPDATKSVQIKAQIEAFENGLKTEFEKLSQQFDHETAERTGILAQIKDNFYRSKYLWRIKESLAKMS
ncbi:iron-sulfur cluster co-chaperone HscB C-terminal domain-containing protein [Pedobacter namyangjuensis]|uniref:iron-sulfur cluster co-chaperone HscB C-terminal domain-containing protein n=1 Tax=Pedobacter namyangjuensis TaxID=600626 RepID=UPI000DE27CE8|nr:iron-sulfur cluster co-chaperone HscB C-terminal domain-containing protein [Pedobacter namyangjuensis]